MFEKAINIAEVKQVIYTGSSYLIIPTINRSRVA